MTGSVRTEKEKMDERRPRNSPVPLPVRDGITRRSNSAAGATKYKHIVNDDEIRQLDIGKIRGKRRETKDERVGQGSGRKIRKRAGTGIQENSDGHHIQEIERVEELIRSLMMIGYREKEFLSHRPGVLKALD